MSWDGNYEWEEIEEKYYYVANEMHTLLLRDLPSIGREVRTAQKLVRRELHVGNWNSGLVSIALLEGVALKLELSPDFKLNLTSIFRAILSSCRIREALKSAVNLMKRDANNFSYGPHFLESLKIAEDCIKKIKLIERKARICKDEYSYVLSIAGGGGRWRWNHLGPTQISEADLETPVDLIYDDPQHLSDLAVANQSAQVG